MSEKEFKNNRPKSDEKDLEGLVQNFSQKFEPAAKKVKKTVGKIERQGMHVAEHYAYLPRYVDISKFADLTKTVTDFFTDFCEERPELWKYAEDTIDKEDLAILEYYDFNAKEAKEYLKRNVKRFAMRLMQNKDEERLAKLLKMNIASKQLLKLLLEEAGEMMPTARAYILEMLGNTKTNKSFSI